MLVNRSEDQEKPATMSIYFRQSAADDAAAKGGKGKAKAAAAAAIPLAQQAHSSTTGECPAPAPEEEHDRSVQLERYSIC